MRQVIQSARSGKLTLKEVPDPKVRRGQILVRTRASLISPGTERTVVKFAKKNQYEVKLENIRKLNPLPKTDLIIMISSLYHFHDIMENLIHHIMKYCDSFIISEPVIKPSSL